MRDTPSATELDTIAAGMRAWVLHANQHPGGASSTVEAITALYFSGATTLASLDVSGDRLIYSKGHAAAPWYFALWALGALPGTSWCELAGFGQIGHPVPRMPRRGALPGMDMSTGALGQGLSFGAGAALADRRTGRPTSTFVLLGDGECTEGQVWEAAMTASRLGLRRLVALVDANGSGSVIPLPRREWAGRWRGFGWQTVDVDGHDVTAIAGHLRAVRDASKPTAIILATVKGKGLLAPVEGSNTLSAHAAPEHLPDLNTDTLIDAALAVVDKYQPAASAHRRSGRPIPTTIPARVQLDRRTLTARVQGHPVGAQVIAKKALGGELASELEGTPVLWMAPDAIRNSGLLTRMERVGSWHWDTPHSDVLQCAIAEQDAVSLAAGAAGAGLVAVLFSMEGFYWRALDQIRESIAFPQIPVLLVGTSGGVGDPLGPMVQSDGCLSALSAIPGLEIFEASDINTAKVLAIEALTCGHPAYLRLPHEAVPVRHDFDELASRGLDEGMWTLQDDPQPHVVILTAGAMRQVALAAADLLRTDQQLPVRVLEILSPTRFARLPPARRDQLVPPSALPVSVHNAPSRVLGSLLPAGALTIGVDTYGIAGWPQARLYEAAGLTAQHVHGRITQELQ